MHLVSGAYARLRRHLLERGTTLHALFRQHNSTDAKADPDATADPDPDPDAKADPDPDPDAEPNSNAGPSAGPATSISRADYEKLLAAALGPDCPAAALLVDQVTRHPLFLTLSTSLSCVPVSSASSL